jgi:uncharacterized coiled-coil DUF342 family protein
MSDVVVTETLSQTVERQAREIERLKKDVIHWREARRSCIAAGDMMQAEIERLRADLSKWKSRAQVLYMRNTRLITDTAEWFDKNGVPQ